MGSIHIFERNWHDLPSFKDMFGFKNTKTTKAPKLRKVSTRSTHHVYVIELSKKVWQESRKFREANPQYNGVSECLYVGMTSSNPESRFKKHKTGHRNRKGHKVSSNLVEKYGLYLRSSLYGHLKKMTRTKAALMEEQLANELRRKGHAVWWN